MNLLELFIKIGVKDEASEKISSLSSKLGNGLKTAAEFGVKAIAAASTAIVGLTTLAVKNYAEYEQLVGGVETLFGDSADRVMEYANNAYKTAGMSANQYMELATSFSASLLQSLENDTQAAADYADMAMQDMSDNANKMGTDMERITDAYQGFAKQNYTMLDNLKLGYGGTKSEMERLIADANKLKEANGEMADLSIENYSDIIEAIHLVQDEMGITGTTMKEATETISGSLNMTKAAWDNLVTGIADDNADFGQLIDNFVESAGYAANNIIPRIEIALVGVGELIESLFPIIMEQVPQIITNTLPKILVSAGNVIVTFASGVIQALPQLLETAVSIVEMLANGLAENASKVSEKATDLINTLVNGLVNAIPKLVPAIVEIIAQLALMLTDPSTLAALVDGAIAIVESLAEGILAALPVLLEQAPVIISNLVNSIIRAVPKLLVAAVNIIMTLAGGILKNLPKILSAGISIISTLISGLVKYAGNLIKAGADIVVNVGKGITSGIKQALTWGKDLIQNFIDGIKSKIGALKDTVKGMAQTVKDFLGFSEPKYGPLSNFHTYAPDMMELFAKGIKDNEHLVTDQISKSFDFGRKTIGLDVDANASQFGTGVGFGSASSVSVVQNIYSKAQTAADLMQQAMYEQEKAVFLGV